MNNKENEKCKNKCVLLMKLLEIDKVRFFEESFMRVNLFFSRNNPLFNQHFLQYNGACINPSSLLFSSATFHYFNIFFFFFIINSQAADL